MPLSLCFSVLEATSDHSHYVFQYWEPLRRRKKGVGVQRDEEEKKEIEKLGLKGKCVFSCMCIFDGVCREIEGV